MANDQTCFFVRKGAETFGSVHKRVSTMFSKHKLVLAFAEKQATIKGAFPTEIPARELEKCSQHETKTPEAAEQMRFQDEIVEADTARYGKSCKTPTETAVQHEGRTLVLKGRRTRKWSACALRPTSSTRAMPPESVQVRGLGVKTSVVTRVEGGCRMQSFFVLPVNPINPEAVSRLISCPICRT